jgi:hypothetical protein
MQGGPGDMLHCIKQYKAGFIIIKIICRVDLAISIIYLEEEKDSSDNMVI